METGFSLYLGSGYEKNREVIEKAVAAKMKYVFTSLHIPEEKVDDYAYEVKRVMDLCKANNLLVMVDVSNNTLSKLNLDNLSELKEWGFSLLRIDFGVTLKEIADLTHEFIIVLNSSTITPEELNELKSLGANFEHLLSCHNFYPKPLSGISMQQMIERNKLFKSFGIKTMNFVASDKDYRGPVHAGLPTLEAHRYQPVILSMVDSYVNGHCDVVCIGDIDCQDETYRQIKQLSENIIELRVRIDDKSFQYLDNSVHSDRVDYSEEMFRSVESRQSFYPEKTRNSLSREVGSICISNDLYGRYEGELEIMRKKHDSDERVNVIGHVLEDDLELFLLGSEKLKLKLLFV